MARFNPFAPAGGKYGAQMGRFGHDALSWNGRGKLYIRHCGGDGFYDRGGAYWGHSNVYAVWTRGGGFCAYVEATGTDHAESIVRNGAMPDGYTVTPWPGTDCYRVTPPSGEADAESFTGFITALEWADEHSSTAEWNAYRAEHLAKV